MSAKSRATRQRQWAANAIVAAMRATHSVDQETLLMIALQHLVRAQKAERSAIPRLMTPLAAPSPAPNQCTGRAQQGASHSLIPVRPTARFMARPEDGRPTDRG
jgi:hypothetical protein